MPGYKWLFDNKPMDYSWTEAKMKVMVKLGVPYSEDEIANAQQSIKEQAAQIEQNLYADPEFVKSYENARKQTLAKGEVFVPMSEREIIAMIAYLQRMGTDIKVKETTQK
jgi:cytochrome c oxidase cbb3-type subunit I/II